MSEKNSKKKLIDNPKFVKISVIVAVIAMFLIFISSYIDFSSLGGQQSTEEYCAYLEQNLNSIITQIDGVGEAKIFLTLDNNGENVYLDNSDTKTKSITPVVRGVVIVCDGGDDPLIVARVMSAVTKSLDISSDKVCITKLSK